jgi:hypothetical protein
MNIFISPKGLVSIYGRGGTKEKCFSQVVKILLIQRPTIKKPKVFLPNSNINKKISTHPWPKTLQKDTIQLSHMSFTTSVTQV